MVEAVLEIAPYGIKDEKSNLPNPTQERVLKWVDNIRTNPIRDHIPVLYLQGGVGSGKSRALIAPVIEMLLEIPGLRILWGRQDLKDLKLSIMDKFFEILPPELIAGKSEQYHYYDIRQNNGSTSRIYFSGLKDLTGLGSQEFGVIVVTEALEMTEQVYRGLKRRCRQENVVNVIMLEGEAPNETHWLANLTNKDHPDYDADIEQWEVSTYENWENLPLAYRGSLERMPESWKKKYLLGKYGFIPDGTPFYTGFKEDLHKRELEANKYKPLLLGWDWGFRHPSCVITQIDDKGRWCILRELIGTDIIIDQFADVVKTYLNEQFSSFECKSYGDPAGNQKSDKNELTSIQILQSKGFSIVTKPSTYRERKEIIEQKLAHIIQGIPALVVDPHCKTVIDGFLGGYHYPLIKQGERQTTIKTEVPYEDGYYEHPMNALEYIAVNMFKPIPQAHQKALEAKRKALVYERTKARSNAGIRFGRK